MRWINVDLLEMYRVALDRFNVRKADRDIVRQCDPQMARTLSLLQNLRGRRFVQDGLRRVPDEESRGCQLNRWQPRQVLWAGILIEYAVSHVQSEPSFRCCL